MKKRLSLHLTDLCNQSCSFCVVGSEVGRPEKVRIERIYKFVEEHAGQGYEMVNLHGGEPTLTKELIPLLDRLQKLGYPAVSIQTNGRKLRDPKFVEELISRGVTLFVISLHGADAEMHDGLTNTKNSWREMIEGIKNVKRVGRKVRTNTCVTKKNYSTLPDIIKLALDLGVDHINLSNIHPANKAFVNFKTTAPRLRDIMPGVKAAVDTVVAAKRVVTVEGFPPCVLGDYETYMIDWEESPIKMLFHDIVLDNYDAFMRNEARKFGQKCGPCIRRDICGGPYKEYVLFYDWEAFSPVLAAPSARSQVGS